MVADRQPRIAYVYEEDDPREGGRLSGRFSAHWEATAGDTWRRGPTDVSADEAIAWAQRQAGVVLVRLGEEEEMYSAGDELAAGVTRRWPEGGLTVVSRPVGEPPSGGRDVVGWKLEIPVDGPADVGKLRAIAIQQRVDAAPNVRTAAVLPHGRGYRVDCVVEARSSEAALLDVGALVPDQDILSMGRAPDAA